MDTPSDHHHAIETRHDGEEDGQSWGSRKRWSKKTLPQWGSGFAGSRIQPTNSS